MAKSAVLLLFLGLALGLWLGFNPQAHKQVVQDWDNTKAFFVRAQAQVSGIAPSSAAQSNAQGQTKSKPAARPITLVWRQISSVFTTMWNSLGRVWLQIRANLNLKKL